MDEGVVAMAAEREEDIESLGHLERRRSDELVREEKGDAALDRLVDVTGDRQSPGRDAESYGPRENEFTCRACHLIFARSCLTDRARMLCRDCAALATDGELPPHEIPLVHHAHHPCPACGALVMVPEREEVSCGFVCPSCRVHLGKRDGHLHLVWNHRDERIVEVEL
jgi:hypothetical protein